MVGYNHVTLLGNLGADPELRSTNSGRSVLKMRVATTAKWKSESGQQQERTEWHSVVIWGKRAEGLATFLRKGHTVLVDGEIRYSQYDHEGTTRYRTDINANDIVVVGGGDRKPAASAQPQNDDEPLGSDIPF